MYIVAEVTELNEYESEGGIRAMSKRLRNTAFMVRKIASTVMIGMALLTATVVSLGWPMIGKQLTASYDGYFAISSTASLNTRKSADEKYSEEVAAIMQQAGLTNSPHTKKRKTVPSSAAANHGKREIAGDSHTWCSIFDYVHGGEVLPETQQREWLIPENRLTRPNAFRYHRQ